MALFAIGDLHLSLGTNKPMDLFYGWDDYVARLEQNWRATVGERDTVVIPGDFSWGVSMEEALPDFRFLEALPGRKLLLKGNHDYWWDTRHKMEAFFEERGLTTIGLLHNSADTADGMILCGTRGWIFMPNEEHDLKISAREALRLELSLQDAERFGKGEKIVFLHYPPVYANEIVPNMMDMLLKYGVKRVYYGHIHGAARGMANEGDYMGIAFKLISADHLRFTPWRIEPAGG